MAGYLHYSLSCADCGNAILLPLEMLGTLFGDRADPTKNEELIAAACSHCKRVQNYNLAKQSQNPPWGPMVVLDHPSGWEYLGWLQCDSSTCESRLPLFAIVNRSSNSTIADTDFLWIDGLHCANGHLVPRPKSEPIHPE
jgi:hypothetical protein